MESRVLTNQLTLKLKINLDNPGGSLISTKVLKNGKGGGGETWGAACKDIVWDTCIPYRCVGSDNHF